MKNKKNFFTAFFVFSINIFSIKFLKSLKNAVILSPVCFNRFAIFCCNCANFSINFGIWAIIFKIGKIITFEMIETTFPIVEGSVFCKLSIAFLFCPQFAECYF